MATVPNITIAPDTAGVYQIAVVDSSISTNLQNTPLVVNTPGSDTHTITSQVLDTLQDPTVYIQVSRHHPGGPRDINIRFFVTQNNFDDESIPSCGILLYAFTTSGGGLAFRMEDIESSVPCVTGRMCTIILSQETFSYLYLLGSLQNQNPSFPINVNINGTSLTLPSSNFNDISQPYSLPIPASGDVDVWIYDDPANLSAFSDPNNTGRIVSSQIVEYCTILINNTSTLMDPLLIYSTPITNSGSVETQVGNGTTNIVIQRDLRRFTEDVMHVNVTPQRYGHYTVTAEDRSGTVFNQTIVSGENGGPVPVASFDYANYPSLFTIDPDSTGQHPSCTITITPVAPLNSTDSVEVINGTGYPMIQLDSNGNQTTFIGQYVRGSGQMTIQIDPSVASYSGAANISYLYAQDNQYSGSIPNLVNYYIDDMTVGFSGQNPTILVINDAFLDSITPYYGGDVSIDIYSLQTSAPFPTTTTTSTTTLTPNYVSGQWLFNGIPVANSHIIIYPLNLNTDTGYPQATALTDSNGNFSSVAINQAATSYEYGFARSVFAGMRANYVDYTVSTGVNIQNFDIEVSTIIQGQITPMITGQQLAISSDGSTFYQATFVGDNSGLFFFAKQDFGSSLSFSPTPTNFDPAGSNPIPAGTYQFWQLTGSSGWQVIANSSFVFDGSTPITVNVPTSSTTTTTSTTSTSTSTTTTTTHAPTTTTTTHAPTTTTTTHNIPA